MPVGVVVGVGACCLAWWDARGAGVACVCCVCLVGWVSSSVEAKRCRFGLWLVVGLVLGWRRTLGLVALMFEHKQRRCGLACAQSAWAWWLVAWIHAGGSRRSV